MNVCVNVYIYNYSYIFHIHISISIIFSSMMKWYNKVLSWIHYSFWVDHLKNQSCTFKLEWYVLWSQVVWTVQYNSTDETWYQIILSPKWRQGFFLRKRFLNFSNIVKRLLEIFISCQSRQQTQKLCVIQVDHRILTFDKEIFCHETWLIKKSFEYHTNWCRVISTGGWSVGGYLLMNSDRLIRELFWNIW